METDSSHQPSETERTVDVRGSNQSGMRAHNERLVLSLVRRRGSVAKAEIARRTGLSAQTVSVIMRALERDGLVERCEPIRGKVGQPLVPMKLASRGAYFFGLKVGRRSADLILVDFVGRPLGQVRQTYRFPTPEGTIAFARDAVDQLCETLDDRQRSRIAGLGIAMPFELWSWAKAIGVSEASMKTWRDRDIRQEISDMFDFPVYLQNDATCACGAELVFGQSNRPPNFLHFFIGYFVGGGVVLNSGLFYGPSGNAGALGSMPVASETGRVRQLISVASLSGLEKMIEEAGGDTQGLWETSASWTIDPVLLRRWIDTAAGGLAHAIAAACSVIDFELVLIDGWMPESVRSGLVARTAEHLSALDTAGIVPPRIDSGSIGPDARSLGAASLPLSQRFLVDLNAFMASV